MIRKLIAIDLFPMEKVAKDMGFKHIPIKELIEWTKNNHDRKNVDVVETLVTIVKKVPSDETPETIANTISTYNSKLYALQMSGAKVLECPSKPSLNTLSGYKQSDDQRLMIYTLITAIKLKAEYVVLMAADGDYAPMIEALRTEGIRTEVVAPEYMLSNDLRRYAIKVIDYNTVLQGIAKSSPEIITNLYGY